jgi:dinuclear metal center YbgI/SA1388 family protein
LSRKVKDILEVLDSIAPFETAETWDNCGLLVGELNDSFSEIVLSLDIDETVIERASEGSLIIVHHPLIFGKLKALNFSTYPSNYLKKMIKKDLKLIALHTNFDKAVLNRYVFEQVLGFQVERESEFTLFGTVDMSRDEVLTLLKERFKLPVIKHTEIKERVKRVALTTGSGMSLLNSLGDVDLFLTGDIKYHEAMEAKSLGIGVADIGHYESEIFFAEALKALLDNRQIKSIILDSENPFKIS